MKSMNPNEIAVLGIPFDANSSFLRGPAAAPARMRAGLYSDSANLSTENYLDLGSDSRWQLVGDLELYNSIDDFERIEQAVAALLAQDLRVLSLGGDHSITYPIMQAYSQKYQDLTLLQFDAHPDLYDDLDGNRLSHACPFARIMEAGLAKRLVQVGIRTITRHQQEQAATFGVEVIEMTMLDQVKDLHIEGPLYISLDMDCLDPAFAPGVSHYEPGGLSTRELLSMIQNLDAPIVGADLVEYNPERDPQGITEMVAAKLLKELIAKMLGSE
jgi:agmatinase